MEFREIRITLYQHTPNAGNDEYRHWSIVLSYEVAVPTSLEPFIQPEPEPYEDADSLYYYGTPCKRGHDGLRYRNNDGCVECVRARNRENKRKAKRGAPRAKTVRYNYLIDGQHFHSCVQAARALSTSTSLVNFRCNSDGFPDWIRTEKGKTK